MLTSLLATLLLGAISGCDWPQGWKTSTSDKDKPADTGPIGVPHIVNEPAQERAKPKAPQPTLPPPAPERNIIAVRIFANPEPWISFDKEGDQNPEGFALTVMLESGATGKAVRGDGNILIELFRVTTDSRGQRRRLKVQEWEFTPEQALAYLARRPTVYGWGYGFRLNWGDAPVLGRDIQVVVRFSPRDGNPAASRPLSLRVPKRIMGP